MERRLSQLVEKLRKHLGERLEAVVLYGSAAGGDHNPRYSDINILCVLSQVHVAELSDCSSALQWWRDQGNPSPLLFGRRELPEMAESFPIEFHDLLERRRVLFGDDVIASLSVSDKYYRAQVEHELLANFLRLRQRSAGALTERGVLIDLLANSVSSFTVLIRHALRLSGSEPLADQQSILEQASTVFGLNPESFDTLLALREGRVRRGSVDPKRLLSQYLDELERVSRVLQNNGALNGVESGTISTT